MGTHDARKMTIVYTPGYAPPEQMLGQAEPRSDLFSLAATLYHLATGKEPDGHQTADSIALMLDDPTNPIPPEHRWFFELLMINLAADANERYFSAAEFKADLERKGVTKQVRCQRCQTVNPVRRPYCVSCAGALTAPIACEKCGGQNRMGSRWCIHCGKRLGLHLIP